MLLIIIVAPPNPLCLHPAPLPHPQERKRVMNLQSRHGSHLLWCPGRTTRLEQTRKPTLFAMSVCQLGVVSVWMGIWKESPPPTAPPNLQSECPSPLVLLTCSFTFLSMQPFPLASFFHMQSSSLVPTVSSFLPLYPCHSYIPLLPHPLPLSLPLRLCLNSHCVLSSLPICTSPLPAPSSPSLPYMHISYSW